MAFQITKVSDVGTGNPIVARMLPGLQDIIKMAQIGEAKQKAITKACYEIKTALVQAEKAAKPLMNEIKLIEQNLATDGVKTQNNGRIIETPGVLNLDNTKIFLKFGKQALQYLAVAMGQILDEDFKGPHFHKVLDRARKLFGADAAVTKLLEVDQAWIKDLIELRSEDEHPKSEKAFVTGFDIQVATSPGQYIVRPPRFFNETDLLSRLESFSHNLLTFSEELIAHSLAHFFPSMVVIYEIPEEQRDVAMPVRFRLGLKKDVHIPGAT